MHEHEIENGQQICTTTGEAPSAVREKQRAEGNSGQHSSYIVLCEEERAKGFVRPYRDAYRHVGREFFVPESGRAMPQPRREGGCGTITTMGRALSETYARDPGFYGSTFCVRCGAHFPVAEFTWYEMDGTEGPQVGS